MTIKYIAKDGREFNTENECLDYEMLIVNSYNIKRTLRKIKEFCDKIPEYECDRKTCPFAGICGKIVHYWELD